MVIAFMKVYPSEFGRHGVRFSRAEDKKSYQVEHLGRNGQVFWLQNMYFREHSLKVVWVRGCQ